MLDPWSDYPYTLCLAPATSQRAGHVNWPTGPPLAGQAAKSAAGSTIESKEDEHLLLDPLPHRVYTVAHRTQALDQLKARIPATNHKLYNPNNPTAFALLRRLKPWDRSRSRPEATYTDQAWPEDRQFANRIERQILGKPVTVYQSSLSLYHLVHGPNSRVQTTHQDGDDLVPTLVTPATQKAFKIVDEDNQSLVVYLP